MARETQLRLLLNPWRFPKGELGHLVQPLPVTSRGLPEAQFGNIDAATTEHISLTYSARNWSAGQVVCHFRFPDSTIPHVNCAENVCYRVCMLSIARPKLMPSPNRLNVAQTVSITNCLYYNVLLMLPLLPQLPQCMVFGRSLFVAWLARASVGNFVNPSIGRYLDQEHRALSAICSRFCRIFSLFEFNK